MPHMPERIQPTRRTWRLLLAALLMGMAGISAPVGAAIDSGGGDWTTSSAPTATVSGDVTAPDGSLPVSGSNTQDEADGISYNENAGGGGGKNNVRIVNRQNSRLRVKGNVQLNQIPGPTVEPINLAYAYGSCTDCQTFAVALQINLISRNTTRVTPENAAIAVNVDCTRCHTVAHAYQYVYSVDDPMQVPQEVNDLIKELDRELRAIHSDNSLTLADAEARIAAVIKRFTALASSLRETRDEEVERTSPDVTPIATATVGTPQPVTPSATNTTAPEVTTTATTTPEGADQAAPEATSTAGTPVPMTPTAVPQGATPVTAPPGTPSATATITMTLTPTSTP